MEVITKSTEKEVNNKHKIVLVGIVGTSNDIQLSLYALKCYVYQDKFIKDNAEIFPLNFNFISPEKIDEKTREILQQIKIINPDIVGFSCYLWNIDAVKVISKKLKKEHKDLIIIMGGPEISKDDIISGQYNDYCANFLIFSEGEKPFLSLLLSLFQFSNLNHKNIKGLAYRHGKSFVCSNQTDFIEDLKKIPSIYLNGFVPDKILTKEGIRVNVESQRGCSFRCAYCFYHKDFSKIRYRDAGVVVDEFDYAHKRGVRMGRILDANFLSNKDFAKEIMRGLIKRKIKMNFFVEVLPQFVDEEIAYLFGEFGGIAPDNKVKVGIGIQTLNQEALAVIKRKIPVRFFEKAFALLQKNNVVIKADILLGLPRETRESYLETLEFISEKTRYGTNYLSLAHLRILPGSDLIGIAKKENLEIDLRDSNHFVYSTPTLSRQDMIDCLKLNTVAFRLLADLEKGMALRNFYFDVLDTLKVSNIDLLSYFSDQFSTYLKDEDVNFVKPDFPDAETYSFKNVREDIPDEWLIEKLLHVKKHNLLN
ncbi:MAG: radical SAM protein [Candidatus Brocadiaceae bacterium]|nr:radical SAM protein [Candidatus Brocadiaceae bacterium]